jgi:hypothetical protein
MFYSSLQLIELKGRYEQKELSLSVFGQDKADLQDAQIQPAASGDTAGVQNPQGTSPQNPPAHPTATTYSDAYQVRLKVHKYASFATIPLFVTELALGQSLYNDPASDARKGAHGAVGAGIIGLFGVNAVTGIWNLKESWNDQEGRKRRLIHSALMLGATGGFVATWATAPHVHNGIITNPSDKSLHRGLAVASISVGTVGYVLMLFKGK